MYFHQAWLYDLNDDKARKKIESFDIISNYWAYGIVAEYLLVLGEVMDPRQDGTMFRLIFLSIWDNMSYSLCSYKIHINFFLIEIMSRLS